MCISLFVILVLKKIMHQESLCILHSKTPVCISLSHKITIRKLCGGDVKKEEKTVIFALRCISGNESAKNTLLQLCPSAARTIIRNFLVFGALLACSQVRMLHGGNSLLAACPVGTPGGCSLPPDES